MGEQTEATTRRLTLGEVLFLKRIGNVGECHCMYCSLSLANSDAITHYVETQQCIYCKKDTSDSLTDVTLQ